jgi:flagellar hook-basal body complex protein FliE
MPSELSPLRFLGPNEITRPERGAGGPGPVGDAQETGFGKQLEGAVGKLDQLQVEADQQADAIAQGGGNLHEVALAFEKADVAMRLATRVRTKLVDAYNEIMRMGI